MRLLRYFGLLTVIFLSCKEDNDQTLTASAELFMVEERSDDNYNVTSGWVGTATITAHEDRSSINLVVTGLTPNHSHAVHMHMGSCEQPGHHWNRMDTVSYCRVSNLGEVWARPKAGDIGNIETDQDGNGTLEIESEFWEINTGTAADILGMILVIHANGEDFAQECFANHSHVHNNPKIACGSILLNTND
jgi:Cu-Zn family superoxide dismutase